jgi:hypothetical protein
LYSTQLYPTPPNNCPALTDPEDAPLPVPGPLAGVVVVAGVVGLVLEHPAIATAITTRMIVMILICEIFIFYLLQNYENA